MVKKIKIKKTEARILVYLRNSLPKYKYARKISTKLDIDYAYVLRSLANMREKQWIKLVSTNGNKIYDLAHAAPLEDAIKTIAGINLSDAIEQKVV